MLEDYITAKRVEIIELTRRRVALRAAPRASEVELTNGIPLFLDQLVDALRRSDADEVADHDAIRTSAGRHGRDLLDMGLGIAQVVHDYGDVCQVVTELAVRDRAQVPAQEFRTLNLCLDDAIAEAVTAYARQRERTITEKGTERLGVLAHELRSLLSTAALAYESIKSGRVSAGGSTGALLQRCLVELGDLIDRSLVEVRLEQGVGHRERISVAELVEEVEIGASIQARARGLSLSLGSVDRPVTIEGDRPIIAAALANLLQNALKFTRARGHVSFTARATDDRVLFEIADECGGLPRETLAELRGPIEPPAGERRGVGLGLAICRRAALASGGELRVRDVAGHGCVFTLDLPRAVPPALG
jgi:signal transduction histidine kinase